MKSRHIYVHTHSGIATVPSSNTSLGLLERAHLVPRQPASLAQQTMNGPLAPTALPPSQLPAAKPVSEAQRRVQARLLDLGRARVRVLVLD